MNKRFSSKVALVLISTGSMMLTGCRRQNPEQEQQQNGTRTSVGHGVMFIPTGGSSAPASGTASSSSSLRSGFGGSTAGSGAVAGG